MENLIHLYLDFLIKEDQISLLFIIVLGSSTFDYGSGGIDIDSNDDIYFSGYTSGSFFGPSIGKILIIIQFNGFLGGNDIILIKLNGLDGSLIFGTRIGSSFDDFPENLILLSNNLFIGGYTSDKYWKL